MSYYAWTTRCIPAFSICAVAVLLVLALVVQPHGREEEGRYNGETTWAQMVLSVYTVLLHIMSIAFPLRVCWSMVDMIRRMKDASTLMPNTRRRRVASLKSDEGDFTFPIPLFVIIIPAYKEEVETLEMTLRVLASHSQARHCYHVCHPRWIGCCGPGDCDRMLRSCYGAHKADAVQIYLAMEEKEDRSAFKAQNLISTFDQSFYKMSYTIHPANIPGEAQGKSSNESWAGKQACKDYPDAALKPNIIMTTMDADTHLSSRYFQHIARMHTEFAETNNSTMYVPPLVFDRNLHRVPISVRTADMMWAGAGLSSLYQGSRVCIPTSVYSLPMTLLECVGGWDTGPGAIGEDMHMYLKCFFALGGNLQVRIVYSAASQCNVSSDVKGLSGYYDGLRARYRQALRHMWGALDTGYATRESIKMVASRFRSVAAPPAELPLSASKSVFNLLQRYGISALMYCSANWSAFYTSTGLHKSLSPRLAETERISPAKPINRTNLMTLYHRLFEAHFLPSHLAVILTTSSIYDFCYPDFMVPKVLHWALDFSGWCRLAGFCLMMCYFYLYAQYHYLCLGLRQEEMRRAGLLEDMADHDGFSTKVFQVAGIFEAMLFPIGGFVFGAIPAMHAEISHLFTDRLTYIVSLKPQLTVKKMTGISTP